jgi:cell wall-associated NlpC family hydrolase
MNGRHWARLLIGRPWQADADGPAAFSCWGLVRYVFRVQHSIEFPAVAVGDGQDVDPGNVRAIKQSVRAAGLRPIGSATPVEGDIVLMRSRVRLHCGLAVRANGALGVLHSTHEAGVIWQPWREAVAGMHHELWRQSA